MKTQLAVLSLVLAGRAAGQDKPTTPNIIPITIDGNAFFKDKERFYVRGIDYQPGGAGANIDPLANANVCKPDIEKFKKLGVNVIRVYSTDNSLEHDECMNALAEAGIYVVLDANNPRYSINRNDPRGSYNAVYLHSVFATIDAFAKYPNTMAFFSGNEVIHDFRHTTLAAPYVKATDRDMRAYIKARKYRKIPVGYSAADVSTNRRQTADYFNCGAEDERSDFFAFNDYSWCSSDFVTAGWDAKVRNFTGYGLPIFLSEYGCNHNRRDFGEVQALMHRNMTAVYSGGLMYEYSMEPNKYGIVAIQGGKAQTGARQELDEFAAFADALRKWPAPADDGGYTPGATAKAAACPTQDGHWAVGSTLLPMMPQGAKKYFNTGAGKGPGLKGKGSQWASNQPAPSVTTGTTISSSTFGAGVSASSNAAVLSHMTPSPSLATFVVSGIGMLFLLVGAAYIF